ncbi:hypothetical protein [Halalkalibaculum sp. DA384]|uniref:hypothetical protein n=1 Tax=Halalkalibaculum sp. DA384 TaxID=3373606 RepID=UPI00375422D4
MTKFLGTYRGAAIYEVGEFDSPAGEKAGSKLMAKAVYPYKQNLQVDFVEQAGTQQKACEKIKKTIDRFLDEHDMTQFEISSLIDSKDQ